MNTAAQDNLIFRILLKSPLDFTNNSRGARAAAAGAVDVYSAQQQQPFFNERRKSNADGNGNDDGEATLTSLSLSFEEDLLADMLQQEEDIFR